MHGFQELMDVAKTLNGPGGCPWDIEQTFKSLRPYILEEAHEALEAIDNDLDEEIIEELGDLFYTVVFYAMVAEREERFTLAQIIETLKEKLIRRHPHVFGEEKAETIEDVVKTWDRVKAKEKEDRKSALDGIPKTLSALLRAQKILKKIEKNKAPKRHVSTESKEQELAMQILQIVEEANREGIDLESAFREEIQKEEKAFRAWELQS